jgi:hypothetical protein
MTRNIIAKMTDNTLIIYCGCNFIKITDVNAINIELSANIIARNKKDEYGDNNEDYKTWYEISECAYNLWKNDTSSILNVKSHIFNDFPLKDWKFYTKYN